MANPTRRRRSAAPAGPGSPSPSGAAASAIVAEEACRPQLRVDTTYAGRTRLLGIWFDRPHEHGVPSGHKPDRTGWFPATDTGK
ncbi:hypothetical protein N7U49_29920 [Streptomyces sp. AD2-2]|nr:hypothetical protein N7U49_29920 [Streptomyces sp. AD2-2]